VFTPLEVYKNAVLEKNSSYISPIFVWIHGGTMMYGDALEENNEPSTFVAMTDLIVVSINYRLASLGFLYMNGTDANGNQGMQDQYLALKWVYENAHSFGGDPNRITIGGDSAGGFSVGFHMIHKPSWPYFTDAVIESGNLLDLSVRLLSTQEASIQSKAIAIEMNCNINETNQIMFECLQSIKDLRKLSEVAFKYMYYPLMVLDGSFVNEQPTELYNRGLIKPCRLLTGFNTKETAYFTGPNISTIQQVSTGNINFLLGLLKDYYSNFGGYSYEKIGFSSFDSFLEGIITEYVSADQRKNKSTIYFDISVDLTSDSSFIYPTIQMADKMAELNQSVYVFSYSYHLSSSLWPSNYEAVHTEQLYMVFAEPLSVKGLPLLNENPYSSTLHNYSAEERKLSETILNYLAEFIRGKEPWLKFKSNRLTSTHRNIMNLNMNKENIFNFDLNSSKYRFWMPKSKPNSSGTLFSKYSIYLHVFSIFIALSYQCVF